MSPMKNNFSTVITYDFFYNADGTPYFCSYSVTVLNGIEVVHSELVQLNKREDFERLLKNAQEQGFKKEFDYTNPYDFTVSETYRKFFLAE